MTNIDEAMKLVWDWPRIDPRGEHRFARHWVVRTLRDLPEEDEVSDLSQALDEHARKLLCEAYAALSTPEQLRSSEARIRVLRIDSKHCVVSIELPTRKDEIGDADMVLTWGTLRRVDEAFGIDDLQGLPRNFWFLLTTSASS